MDDPYAVLGLERGASKADVKSAFRRLAREFHPDVSDAPDARERFEEARSAYEAVIGEAPDFALEFRAGRKSREEREAEEAERLRIKAEQMLREHRAAQVRRETPEEVQLRATAASGNTAAAEREAHRLLKKMPTSAAANGVLGDIAMMKGRRSEALHHFSIAAQSSPDDARYQKTVERLLSEGQAEPREATRMEMEKGPSGWGLGFAVALAFVPLFAPPGLEPSVIALAMAGLILGFAERAGGRTVSLRSAASSTVVGLHPFALAAFLGIVSIWLGLAVYLLLAVARGLANSSASRMLALGCGAVALHSLVLAYRLPSEGVRLALLASGAPWCAVLLGWIAGGAFQRQKVTDSP
ncbi:MAG: DnaJ domain-containing protein [Fimbriimonadaceae bacterium]